jgi:hypothetical protein
MKKLNLKALLLTIAIVIGFSGFGYLLYKFQTETLYIIIGIIVLMFIRHTYIAIDNSTKK